MRRRGRKPRENKKPAAKAVESMSGTIRVEGDVQLQVGMQQPTSCNIAPMNSNLTAYQVSNAIDLDTIVYAMNRSENPTTVTIQVRNSIGEKLVDTTRDLGPWGQAIISAKALLT